MPTVRTLEQQYGSAVQKAILVKELESFLTFLNVGKVMDQYQAAETIKLIAETYPYMNLADIRLFFNRMKRGLYGKFYDRIDGQIILECMEKYVQERMNESESMNLSDHYKMKKEYSSGYCQRYIDVLKDILKEKEVKVNQDKPISVKTKLDPFQVWMKQFDNLHKFKYGFDCGIRAIKIRNEVFTIDSFLDRKIKNYEKFHEQDR